MAFTLLQSLISHDIVLGYKMISQTVNEKEIVLLILLDSSFPIQKLSRSDDS